MNLLKGIARLLWALLRAVLSMHSQRSPGRNVTRRLGEEDRGFLTTRYMADRASIDGYRQVRAGLVLGIAAVAGGFLAFGVANHGIEVDLSLLAYGVIDLVLCISWSYNDGNERRLKISTRRTESLLATSAIRLRIELPKRSRFAEFLRRNIARTIGLGTLVTITGLSVLREWKLISRVRGLTEFNNLNLFEKTFVIAFLINCMISVIIFFLFKKRY